MSSPLLFTDRHAQLYWGSPLHRNLQNTGPAARLIRRHARAVTSHCAVQDKPRSRATIIFMTNCEFMQGHRNYLVTMLDLQSAAPDTESRDRQANSDRAKPAELLTDGQHEGDFRDFDPDLMAGFILSLRNGVILRAASQPGFDLAACTDELLTTIQTSTA
jgi:hypothetical protein